MANQFSYHNIMHNLHAITLLIPCFFDQQNPIIHLYSTRQSKSPSESMLPKVSICMLHCSRSLVCRHFCNNCSVSDWLKEAPVEIVRLSNQQLNFVEVSII